MSINSTRQEPYPPAPSSAHNIQGAAGRSSRPRHRGLAWVLAPSTFCRPNGRHRALCSKTGENAAQRCPRPPDLPAWSGRDGPNNTRLCSPAASCPRPPSRAPPCDLGQGLGARSAPSSLRSEPRQKAQTAATPLTPLPPQHSAQPPLGFAEMHPGRAGEGRCSSSVLLPSEPAAWR